MRLYQAARRLREAQIAYMALRERPESMYTSADEKEAAGAAVAEAAADLDKVLDEMKGVANAFGVVDGELRYQVEMTKDASRPDMIQNLSPGDHIVAMEHCLAEARREWYSGSHPHKPAAHYIRKVAALAIRFLFTFSAPRREGF